MSNYTKLVNEKAILIWIADSLKLSRGTILKLRNEQGDGYWIPELRKKIESLSLNDALTLARILDIVQPSGNPLHFQNLDQQFLLEADGSPLEKNMINGMANSNE